MEATIKQVQGLTLTAKADSGHWIVMDGPEQFGGSDAASKPLELFLIGLGGCTSMDILSILQKKRVDLTDYECTLLAERAKEHPKVFTHVTMKFVFYGKDISKSAVERAIEMSKEKYCSASAMLKESVPIKVEYEIKEPG
jgi:putative redox protein